jgi:hypothetical protein
MDGSVGKKYFAGSGDGASGFLKLSKQGNGVLLLLPGKCSVSMAQAVSWLLSHLSSVKLLA